MANLHSSHSRYKYICTISSWLLVFLVPWIQDRKRLGAGNHGKVEWGQRGKRERGGEREMREALDCKLYYLKKYVDTPLSSALSFVVLSVVATASPLPFGTVCCKMPSWLLFKIAATYCTRRPCQRFLLTWHWGEHRGKHSLPTWKRRKRPWQGSIAEGKGGRRAKEEGKYTASGRFQNTVEQDVG